MQFQAAVIAAIASVASANILCGLTNYPSATYGPINSGLGNLLNAPSDTVSAGANSCNVIQCSYGTGFALCAGDADITATQGDVGTAVQDALNQCGAGGSGGDPIQAFQNFYTSSWNILIQGGYSC